MSHLLDLGAGDVHVPSASGKMRPGGKTKTSLSAARTRLDEQKAAGKMSARTYARALARLKRAEQPRAPMGRTPSRGMRVTVDHPKHGRIEVRHLSAVEVSQLGEVACRTYEPISPTEVGEEGKPVWVQLAKAGHYEGHSAGIFDLDIRTFTDIIRNFREVDGEEAAFDFEHASEQPATDGTIPTEGAPAQGWIRRLDLRAGNLWGLVDWLEPARTYIKQGKYKCVSPAIRFNAKHPVTGKAIGARLTSAALTNQPFLRGMQPLSIAAKDRTPADVAKNGAGDVVVLSEITFALGDSPLAYASGEYMPRIKAALKLHELSTAQDCADHLDKLRDHLEACNMDASAVHQGVKFSDYIHPLRDLAGTGMGGSLDDVFDTVQRMIDAAIAEHEARDHAGQTTQVDNSDEDDGDGGDAGDADMKDAAAKAAAAATTPGETDMTPEQIKQLADAQAQVTTLSAKEATASAQVVELTTKLSTTASELNSLKLDLKEKDVELTTLKDENTKLHASQKLRDDKDASDRVEEAFATYKDAKKLTDEDKESMAIELSANKERFEKRYPRVSGDKRHMLRNLSGGDGKKPPKVGGGEGGGGGETTISLRDLSHKIARERKIPLAQAQLVAEGIWKQQQKQAASR